MSLDNTKFIVDGIPKNRTAFARYLQGQVLSGASQALYNRYFNPDNAFYLCPFQVIAGAMFATKHGRRGMNVLITDFPQLEMVIKGQDTFTICGKDSYQLLPLADNKMTVEKKLQVGKAFVGYVVREGLEVSFEPANTNDLLAALHFAQNFTCRIPNILFNRSFFDQLQQQQAYLGVIPQYARSEPVPSPYTARTHGNRNYFILKSMLPHRDPKSRRIMYCDLTLSSIRTSGTSVSQTGLALNTFVQTGAAGEPFAFPIVITGNKLTLDPSFLQYLPVTHSMITNTSLSILSGLHEFGFPIEEHKQLDPSDPVVRLHRPGALFGDKIVVPYMDPLSYKQPPATDYYVLDYHVLSFTNMNVLHNIKTWASGERPANPLLTFIQTASTADGVENTNPFTDGQRDPTGDGTNIKHFFSSHTESIDVRTNNWFRQLVDGKMVGISSFKWSDVPADKQDLPHFLMFASALARSTTMLPLDQHSNLGIIPHFAGTFGGLAVLGGLLGLIIFGLSKLGTHRSTLKKKKVNPYQHQRQYGLIPADIYHLYRQLFKKDFLTSKISELVAQGDPTKKGDGKPFRQIFGNPFPADIESDGLLPMEAFQPASADETSSVMGASTVTQSFAGRLTNRVYTKWYSLNPAVPDRSGVVETAALGQVITYQSNRYGVGMTAATKLVPRSHVTDPYDQKPASPCIGYMIHTSGQQVVGGLSSVGKYFAMPLLKRTLDPRYCIYYGKYQPLGTMNDNPRMGLNVHRIGNPLVGLTNPPVWPRTLLLTPPSAGLETVVTKSLKTLYDAKTNPMAGTPFFNITTPVSFVIPPFTNDDPVFKKSFPMPDRTITIAVPVKRQSLPSGFRRNVDGIRKIELGAHSGIKIGTPLYATLFQKGTRAGVQHENLHNTFVGGMDDYSPLKVSTSFQFEGADDTPLVAYANEPSASQTTQVFEFETPLSHHIPDNFWASHYGITPKGCTGHPPFRYAIQGRTHGHFRYRFKITVDRHAGQYGMSEGTFVFYNSDEASANQIFGWPLIPRDIDGFLRCQHTGEEELTIGVRSLLVFKHDPSDGGYRPYIGANAQKTEDGELRFTVVQP